jgi:catechol 2,3-dioxygenase-like lactoylglutathione lyase family enzyme
VPEQDERVSFFAGFQESRVDVGGDVVLRVRTGGSGPPVVLLHGHPRTHTTWHRVAPLLVAAGAGPAAVCCAVNCDSAEQVDAAVAAWTAAGGRVVRPPARAAEFDGYMAYVADPDGHLWEITFNPGFPIGADGRPRLP